MLAGTKYVITGNCKLEKIHNVRLKMSLIKPFEILLHRELHTHDAKEHLQAQLELLKSVTDYGTFLIAGTFHTSKKEMPEIVVLLVLLKQVVSMLDAIHVLCGGPPNLYALRSSHSLLNPLSLLYSWTENSQELIFGYSRCFPNLNRHESLFPRVGRGA